MKIELGELKQMVLAKLNLELPKHLHYHSIKHVEDVYDAAMTLAHAEGVCDADRELLATAVLLHDSGFIHQSKNHETKGCEIARNYLPEYGYTHHQIEQICAMIMATQIPQTPHSLLEKIICDADLDYLGRDDFWDISNSLHQEMIEEGSDITMVEWYYLQVRFMEEHHYFTQTAVSLRHQGKTNHIEAIKLLLTND
jgi:hypothetical protein